MCPTEPGEGFTAADRMRSAHGFTLLAWGVGALFLLFTGALRVPALDRLSFPAYVLAVAVVYGGFHELKKATRFLVPCPVTGRTLMPVFMLVYLAPFYSWWMRVPHSAFFLLHVLGIVAAGMWLLFEVNRTGARAARLLGRPALGMEVDLLGLGILVAGTAVPVFAVYAVVLARMREISLYAACVGILYDLPRGWLVPALVPLSFTMAACWRLRRVALDAPSARRGHSVGPILKQGL